MATKKTASLAVITGLGLALATLAQASPATANSSGRTTISAQNGTVGVNQVISGTYEYPNGDYPTCFDPRSGVRFDFTLGDGTSLGSADADCTGTSTWTATLNWSPASPGTTTVVASAVEPNLGGSGAPLGSASRRVFIAGQKPAPTSAPSPVRNLKVTGVSTNSISLNWDAPSSSGTSPISGYIVKWSGPTSGQITAPATNANIGSLSANATYTFSVSAANAIGWSDWVNVTQRTATAPKPGPAPAPVPVVQQQLVGPSWSGGGPKVKSGQWRTFNDSASLDTNAGREANLSSTGRSSSVRTVSFRYVGDQVQIRAVLKPGATRGTFTLVESAPAVPGFTAMRVTRTITVVK